MPKVSPKEKKQRPPLAEKHRLSDQKIMLSSEVCRIAADNLNHDKSYFVIKASDIKRTTNTKTRSLFERITESFQHHINNLADDARDNHVNIQRRYIDESILKPISIKAPYKEQKNTLDEEDLVEKQLTDIIQLMDNTMLHLDEKYNEINDIRESITKLLNKDNMRAV